jgi:hypothetical protein
LPDELYELVELVLGRLRVPSALVLGPRLSYTGSTNLPTELDALDGLASNSTLAPLYTPVP